MGIKQTTSNETLRKKIEEAAERLRLVYVRRLEYIGEMCVNKARNLPTPPQSVYWDSEAGEAYREIPRHTPHYIDWTANLRSSIGYVVTMDGHIVSSSNFAQVKGKEGDGKQGSDQGKDYAKQLARKMPQGIALIVVAGMNYAVYVQRRGYDVTASAELLAEQLLRQLKINAKLMHL